MAEIPSPREGNTTTKGAMQLHSPAFEGRDPYFVDLHHQRGCAISNSLSNNKFLLRIIRSTKKPRKEKFYYYSCEHDGQNQKLGKKTKNTSILRIERKLGGVSYHKVEYAKGETTWREINCDRITNFYPRTYYEGAYVDGAVYFYCGHCNIYGLNIVAFNCRIEEVRIISLWDNYRDYRTRIGRRFNLVELEGKLAAIDVMCDYMRVWILQSPETGEWIRQPEIVIPPKVTYGNLVHRRCTSTTDKKEIAFTKPYSDATNRILFYDFKENKWRSERILGLADNVKIIGIYNYEYCIYSV
uniref:F-box protein At5g52620 n=1 Tax=Nicotiana sylvestris TaxID=4096 RepID=A0A1U7VN01_NICSY|nr:PREDICTED: putative F-box protein At5g52620 [Nicotiana sylvestris]